MDRSSDEPRLLSAGEVCRLLHVARSTLVVMRRRGDLKGYPLKGSGHYRYPSNQPLIEEARAALAAAEGER